MFPDKPGRDNQDCNEEYGRSRRWGSVRASVCQSSLAPWRLICERVVALVWLASIDLAQRSPATSVLLTWTHSWVPTRCSPDRRESVGIVRPAGVRAAPPRLGAVRCRLEE